MNEQIYLHSLPLLEVQTIASLSGLWFSKVGVWLLLNVDIPQLSADGIVFSTDSWSNDFYWTYSIQASSTFFDSFSFLDADALEAFIKNSSDFV